jgi:bacterioferritin
MSNKKEILDSLNNLLQGEYMAIAGYNQFIAYVNEQRIKSEFQRIQHDHREHAAILAEYIQNLGDIPREKTGLKGTMADTMLRMDLSVHNDPLYILNKAYESENKGIKMAREVVKGDLDRESKKLVDKILTDDTKHLERMKKLITEYKM